MTAARSPDALRQVIQSKRFLAADRAKLDLGEIDTWDPYLLRDHRLLVPIDVQALFVAPGNQEPMVRLPMLVSGENGNVVDNIGDGMPAPFTAGSPRPAGVHIHWAMPDALLRGTMDNVPSGTPNRLALPLLPDRWVVLRILLPMGASAPAVTGWVLEADRAVAVPLGSWTENGAASRDATPMGAEVLPEKLTGTVGGGATWCAVYDAVLNRFAFHDPLDDVATLAPNGVDQDCAAYLVAGWWRDPAHDPLDAARSNDSLHELLDRLRWRLLYEWGDARWDAQQNAAEQELRQALGLTTGDRWSSPRPVSPEVVPRGAAPGAATITSKTFVQMDKTFVEQPKIAASSAFATEAVQRFAQPAWHLRSTLLHGAIYGVPVHNAPAIDRRPFANQLAVALGEHDDDVLAALAVPASATPDQRRDAERLLAAFTAQRLDRIADPNGIVDIEEQEHAAGFTALRGGSAGTDRFLQRVQTGGVGGLDLGRAKREAMVSQSVLKNVVLNPQAPRHARPMDAPAAPGAGAAGGIGSSMVFSASAKPALKVASEIQINDLARSRVGDVLAPTQARVVDRPAPRFAFPNDPMVALRSVNRSLRHGNDGRGSADGKLTCRWPTHVITEITGIVAEDRFIKSLGSGAIPPEVLTLAREVMIHDPYHAAWITEVVAPTATDRTPIIRRLRAESAMRFGADGTFDGTTVAFSPTTPSARRARRAAAVQQTVPGLRQQQSLVADELMRFSLYRGADPDLVGVTTWAQPWVPMWLEWEMTIEGLDPPALDAWLLSSVDFERVHPGIDGDSVTLRGRALLTSGGATTLHSAVTDWLAAENARDADGLGLVDEDVEAALQTLDEAVQHLDIVTAALDGVRTQLLGFPPGEGLHRPTDGVTESPPAPESAPRSLIAGAVRLSRARLLDIFGRTLDVPVDGVLTPTRASVDDEAGALAVTPRLLRPARWRFRPVDAATVVGTEGTEARVDQIEATLQVNPVAGFVMPDHLDESLEVFGVDGAPIGELLHEPVSGGVMWEIAAGREGPADAGPLFGLTASQLALGRFAAGLVAADAAAREGAPLDPESPHESALSALLRAIDTTLWSVDTLAALGSEHVAGLVGRPIAVVRAQLRLELMPPTDVDLSDSARAAEWTAAEEAAKRFAFPVRIGEVTRSDDGVLGFFVDDDFSQFRIVDKAIAGAAREGGRNRGQLGLFTHAGNPTPTDPITNPYIAGTDAADTLDLHIGQTVTLTIFMHPSGKATLTSGVVPRQTIALARDWVGPGLAAIAPSLRTGPVLVETDLDPKKQVRLPKVSVFGKDQNFLWRDTPATWRTDAILAATQTALLPDTPAEFRDGWIRVAPETPDGATRGTSSGTGGGA
jgi:hypothetical protein